MEGRCLLWTANPAQLTEFLRRDMESWVAAASPSHVFVHAAVVVHDGEAWVFPGQSGAGKTTLTAALLRRGFTYASDDYAVFTRDGRVLPYPKPLSVRDATGARRSVAAAELGAPSATGPTPVTRIYVTHFEPGHTFDPVPVSKGTGLLALLEHAPAGRRNAPRVLDVLRRVVEGASCRAGPRGDAERAADVLSASVT